MTAEHENMFPSLKYERKEMERRKIEAIERSIEAIATRVEDRY